MTNLNSTSIIQKEHSPTSFIINSDFKITSVSNSSVKLLGYKYSELVGKSIFETIHSHRKSIENIYKDIITNGKNSSNYYTTRIKADGNIINLRENVTLLTNDKNIEIIVTIEECNNHICSEERVSKLHQCFLKFGTDSIENINIVTATVGELLNATSAFYNRLDGEMLCSWGSWNAPGDLKSCGNPDGHICHQVITNSHNDVLHLRNLQNSIFAKTDPTVIPYKLQTYLGKAVSLDSRHIGSLCVVFQNDFIPDEEELKIFDILSSAIAVEENRLQYTVQLEKSEKQYRSLFEAANDAIFVMGENIFLDCNSKTLELFACTREQIIGHSPDVFSPLVQPDGRNSKEKALEKINNAYNGNPQLFEWEHLRKDGIPFIAEVSLNKIELPNKQYLFAIVRDISDRKKSEKKLKESKKQYKELYQNSTVGIYRSTPEGKIVFANTKFIELLGYNSLDELREIDIQDSLHLNIEDRNKFKKILEEEEVIHGYTIQLKRKDGTTLTIRESARVIKNENDKIVYFEGTVEDITKQRDTELSLIESESKFRSIFESGGSGIVIVDEKGFFIDVNPKFCEIFGYTKEELLKLSFLEITHPDDIEKSKKIMQELHSGVHDHFQIEKRYIRKDGSIIWGSIAIGLFNHKVTNENYNVGIFDDITDRVNLLEELKRRDKVLSALTFSTETFLKTLDWQANIQEVLKRLGKSLDISTVYVYQNHEDSTGDVIASEKYFWYSEKQKGSYDPTILQSFSYVNDGFSRLLETLNKNEVFHGLVGLFNDEEKILLEKKQIKSILVVPIYEIDKLWGFIGFNDSEYERIWTDQEIELLSTAGNVLGVAIKRKKFEEELLQAKLKAEESDKLKSQFLAQISHEIRSPINTILSFSSLLREDIEDNIEDELRSSFDIISSAGKRITRTIDLILNMSEIQAGTYNCIPRKTDIHEDILQNLILEFNALANKKGLEFDVSINTNDTNRIIDRYTVTQIFVNLLDNAFKYTNSGKIELFVTSDAEDKLNIIISDTGIGISSDYLPRLFTPFSQEVQGYSREYDGNGLGLALVKKYCDLNNAIISVESEKNKGTTFKVIFAS